MIVEKKADDENDPFFRVPDLSVLRFSRTEDPAPFPERTIVRGNLRSRMIKVKNL